MGKEIDPFKMQKVNVRSGVHVMLKAYSKKNDTNLTDVVETLIKFVWENDISLKELALTKDKSLIRKYHDYTAAFLVEHEKRVKEYHSSSLKIFMTILDKLNKGIEVKSDDFNITYLTEILNNTQAILLSDDMKFKGKKSGVDFVQLNQIAINKLTDDN